MKRTAKIISLLSFFVLIGCTPTTNSSTGESSSFFSSYVPKEHEMVTVRSESMEKSMFDEYQHVFEYINTELDKDENVWIKVTPHFDSIYYFLITSSKMFRLSSAWDVNSSFIASFEVNDENGNKITNGETTNYYGFYDLYLKKDQTLYLNCSNLSEKENIFYELRIAIPLSDGKVSMMLPDGIERHTHTYGFSFEQYDDKQHKSFCWKDEEYVLENHHFDTDGVCSDCGYKK